MRVVVAGVDGEARRDRLREFAQEVEPADLDRVLPDLARERVDCTLDRVRRLRTSRTAVRVRRRRRREDAGALEVVRDDVVRAAVQPGAEERRAGRDELEIGAEADGQPGPDRADLSLGGRGQLDLLDLVAAVDRRLVALGPRLDPLDRTAELAREHERERLLGVDVQLRAEAAADVRCDDAELRLRNAGHHRQRHARDVRNLRRRPHRQLARRRERLDDDAARLHRVGDQPLLAVSLLHHHRGVRKLLVDIPCRQLPGVTTVCAEVVVDDRRAVF